MLRCPPILGSLNSIAQHHVEVDTLHCLTRPMQNRPIEVGAVVSPSPTLTRPRPQRPLSVGPVLLALEVARPSRSTEVSTCRGKAAGGPTPTGIRTVWCLSFLQPPDGLVYQFCGVVRPLAAQTPLLKGYESFLISFVIQIGTTCADHIPCPISEHLQRFPISAISALSDSIAARHIESR
jgi:hypothetical protein